MLSDTQRVRGRLLDRWGSFKTNGALKGSRGYQRTDLGVYKVAMPVYTFRILHKSYLIQVWTRLTLRKNVYNDTYSISIFPTIIFLTFTINRSSTHEILSYYMIMNLNNVVVVTSTDTKLNYHIIIIIITIIDVHLTRDQPQDIYKDTMKQILDVLSQNILTHSASCFLVPSSHYPDLIRFSTTNKIQQNICFLEI